jgi:hypothetical protein
MWGPALPSLSIPPSCYRTRAEQRKEKHRLRAVRGQRNATTHVHHWMEEVAAAVAAPTSNLHGSIVT